MTEDRYGNLLTVSAVGSVILVAKISFLSLRWTSYNSSYDQRLTIEMLRR